MTKIFRETLRLFISVTFCNRVVFLVLDGDMVLKAKVCMDNPCALAWCPSNSCLRPLSELILKWCLEPRHSFQMLRSRMAKVRSYLMRSTTNIIPAGWSRYRLSNSRLFNMQIISLCFLYLGHLRHKFLHLLLAVFELFEGL